MLGKQLQTAAAGNAGEGAYIEDVFSTYLSTGAGGQTITNGIDLATEGGMVWSKVRDYLGPHGVHDTERGVNKFLSTNLTSAEIDVNSNSSQHSITSFNTDGFTTGNDGGYGYVDLNGYGPYVHWTFRKAEKFFDVVTYTGNGSNRTIAHNLGSVPGTIIVKRTDTTSDWQVYHRSLANTEYLVLNSTAAKATGATRWNSTTPTSSVFSLGTDTRVNASGGTYVAYLFAHDAGGFGDSGDESVIKCGSYTGNNGSPQEINLGWEPQWLLIKNASGTNSWDLSDNMRGLALTLDATLYPNTSDPEDVRTSPYYELTPTGFKLTGNSNNASNYTYVYIAIRRGPMKTPTDATEVFAVSSPASGTYTTTTNFPIDSAIVKSKSTVADWNMMSRMTGDSRYAKTNSTNAETGVTGAFNIDSNVTFTQNIVVTNPLNYIFRRAPGFFDVVAYTGTGVARTVSHNLGVAPELMIIKSRSNVQPWTVYAASINASSNKALYLNSTAAAFAFGAGWGGNPPSTNPNSTTINLGGGGECNSSGYTYIAYLFATCPGVSKVGNYTGTGTTLSVDCGFTAGARFVLIKRTDSTGDWYVWDTARGIVSGNDPYLLLNSTAAENTSTDYIDPLSTGFQISSSAPAAINANGGSYIFLAIA